VSEDEAGRRLAAVMSSPDYSTSGAYWSWSNDSEAFENTLADEAQDMDKAKRVWELSEKLCGVSAPVMGKANAQKMATATA
jgi:protochlorophyllide reductase